MNKGRLVILSGPSCAGKGPLHAALSKFYPELYGRLHKLVLFNSRSPRPGERDGVDYHFRLRPELEALRGRADLIVMDVRGDLQALALSEVRSALEKGDALFEGNPFVGRALMTAPQLEKVAKLTVFLAPLSRDEILFLNAPGRGIALPDFVAEVMRRRLLRRTQRHHPILSLPDLETIERRAKSAYTELKEAHHFAHVIPNHDGEDSENWDAFYYPIGDARKSLTAFAALLQGQVPEEVEKWERDLLP